MTLQEMFDRATALLPTPEKRPTGVSQHLELSHQLLEDHYYPFPEKWDSDHRKVKSRELLEAVRQLTDAVEEFVKALNVKPDPKHVWWLYCQGVQKKVIAEKFRISRPTLDRILEKRGV